MNGLTKQESACCRDGGWCPWGAMQWVCGGGLELGAAVEVQQHMLDGAAQCTQLPLLPSCAGLLPSVTACTHQSGWQRWWILCLCSSHGLPAVQRVAAPHLTWRR